jgi:hypothetical protein
MIRLAGKIEPGKTEAQNWIDWFLDLCYQFTLILLERILQLFGADAIAKPVLDFLVSIGNYIISIFGRIITGLGRSMADDYYSTMYQAWCLRSPKLAIEESMAFLDDEGYDIVKRDVEEV